MVGRVAVAVVIVPAMRMGFFPFNLQMLFAEALIVKENVVSVHCF